MLTVRELNFIAKIIPLMQNWLSGRLWYGERVLSKVAMFAEIHIFPNAHECLYKAGVVHKK